VRNIFRNSGAINEGVIDGSTIRQFELNTNQTFRAGYLSLEGKTGFVSALASVGYSSFESKRILDTVTIVRGARAGELRLEEINERTKRPYSISGTMAVTDTLKLRLGTHQWMRPLNGQQLFDVTESWMSQDTRFVLPGGTQKRDRAQIDWQMNSALFLTSFYERQTFENYPAELLGLLNARADAGSLIRLRSRVFTPIASVANSLGLAESGGGRSKEFGAALNWKLNSYISTAVDLKTIKVNRTDSVNLPFPFTPEKVLSWTVSTRPFDRCAIEFGLQRTGEYFDAQTPAAGTEKVAEPKASSGTVKVFYETIKKTFALEASAFGIGAKSGKGYLGSFYWRF
jgi:hypothetical protein